MLTYLPGVLECGHGAKNDRQILFRQQSCRIPEFKTTIQLRVVPGSGFLSASNLVLNYILQRNCKIFSQFIIIIFINRLITAQWSILDIVDAMLVFF